MLGSFAFYFLKTWRKSHWALLRRGGKGNATAAEVQENDGACKEVEGGGRKFEAEDAPLQRDELPTKRQQSLVHAKKVSAFLLLKK